VVSFDGKVLKMLILGCAFSEPREATVQTTPKAVGDRSSRDLVGPGRQGKHAGLGGMTRWNVMYLYVTKTRRRTTRPQRHSGNAAFDVEGSMPGNSARRFSRTTYTVHEFTYARQRYTRFQLERHGEGSAAFPVKPILGVARARHRRCHETRREFHRVRNTFSWFKRASIRHEPSAGSGKPS